MQLTYVRFLSLSLLIRSPRLRIEGVMMAGRFSPTFAPDQRSRKRFEPSRRDIMDSVENENSARGLLVTLLNLFNVDGGLSLSRIEFTAGAAALGYDISDEKWVGLYKRFAKNVDTLDKDGDGDVDADDLREEELDLSLLGERFRSLYDPLLEALMRQTLRGLIFQSTRISKLEEALDNLLNAGERDRQTKLARVMNKMRNGLLLTTFDAWKKMAKEVKEKRVRIARRWQNRFLWSLFQRWVEMLGEVKAERQKTQNVLGRLKNRQAAMAFRAWVELLEAARQQWDAAGRALTRMLNQHVAMAFSGWWHAVLRARWQRESLAKVTARLKNREVAQAFDAWGEAVREGQRQRRAVASCLGRLRNRLAASAFDAWHEAVVHALTTREASRVRVGNMLMQRTIALAFDLWREQVAHKKGVMARAKQLAARMLNALLGKCYDGWIEYVERQRRVLVQAKNALGPGRLMWMAFSTWSEQVRHVVAERERERMQSDITASIGSELHPKFAGLEGQLASHLEEHLETLLASRQTTVEVAAPTYALEEVEALVTAKLAALHGVLVHKQEFETAAEFNRQALEKIKQKVNEVPVQLEKRVTEEVVPEAVAEAMRPWALAAEEEERRSSQLVEGERRWREQEEERRRVMEEKERKARELQLRKRVMGRVLNRLISTCFHTWADQARRRAIERRAEVAAEETRQKLETERRTMQDDFLNRLRAAGGAWFDEMIGASELMHAGPKGLLQRRFDSSQQPPPSLPADSSGGGLLAGARAAARAEGVPEGWAERELADRAYLARLPSGGAEPAAAPAMIQRRVTSQKTGEPYVDPSSGAAATYEEPEDRVMHGTPTRSYLRTSRGSVVYPVDGSHLTVLDRLDSRYMAPGGQLYARYLEGEFRALQQEMHSMRFVLGQLCDFDARPVGRVLIQRALAKAGDERPMHPFGFSMPPGGALPPTSWQKAHEERAAAERERATTPAQSRRPESAQRRRLKTSQSAAAMLGYQEDDHGDEGSAAAPGDASMPKTVSWDERAGSNRPQTAQ